MAERFDILILGGGMAGLSAAIAVRERDRACSVAILSGETVPPYSRPMLTKLPLEHYRVEDTLVRAPDWYRDNAIALRLNTRVLSLDAAQRVARTDAGPIEYGRCVYALGSSNFIPPIPGCDLPGVRDIRDFTDLHAIKRATLGAGRAAVIGGGVIGLEAAYLLADRGLAVTVLETAPYLMPRLLDEASARELQSRIGRFAVHTGVKVLGVTGETRAQAVAVEGMDSIPADLVVVSCGVRANAAIAAAAGADIGRAVRVNARMETSLPGVFACGDCAEHAGINTGLWAQALAQGAVAGANAAGDDRTYTGSDTALLLHGPEFDLYAEGDLGKQPDTQYTEQVRTWRPDRLFEVNRKPSDAFRRDFLSHGKLVGSFLLGDLSDMAAIHQTLTGEGL